MSKDLYDGVTLTVEIGMSAATGSYAIWDTSVWDTGTWGPDDVWTDVTQWVYSWETACLFGREVDKGGWAWESGTATVVLDNTDGRFSPGNSSSPYVTSGVTQLRPWRPIRITCTYGGTLYPVYRGYIVDWSESWPGEGFDAIMTLACVDELARLAAHDGLEQDPVGEGELSGLRIHRLLDAAGYTGGRDVDSGLIAMQATNLSQDTVTELKLTADSEGGAVFVGPDGAVTFRDRFDLVESGRSNTAQATFGDSTGEVEYVDASVEYNGDQVTNIVSWARANSTAQTSADSTSRALYGDRRDSRTDLICTTDAAVASLTAFRLAVAKDPELRIVGLTYEPRSDPSTMWPLALGLRLRDRVTVVRRPVGGYTLTRHAHISGISHKGDPLAWSTTYQLASATAYDAFTTSLWDVGVWDTAEYFY